VVVLGFALMQAGIANAAELKVEANANGAGDGLVTNTDGVAKFYVLVTKNGKPVTDLGQYSLSYGLSATIIKTPKNNACQPSGATIGTGNSTTDTYLANRGIYTFNLKAPSYTCGGWKAGTYMLEFKATTTFDGGSDLEGLIVK
jgi:hypothetical protein